MGLTPQLVHWPKAPSVFLPKAPDLMQAQPYSGPTCTTEMGSKAPDPLVVLEGYKRSLSMCDIVYFVKEVNVSSFNRSNHGHSYYNLYI